MRVPAARLPEEREAAVRDAAHGLLGQIDVITHVTCAASICIQKGGDGPFKNTEMLLHKWTAQSIAFPPRRSVGTPTVSDGHASVNTGLRRGPRGLSESAASTSASTPVSETCSDLEGRSV